MRKHPDDDDPTPTLNKSVKEMYGVGIPKNCEVYQLYQPPMTNIAPVQTILTPLTAPRHTK